MNRQEPSRLNGAKSRGRITTEGEAASSRNALKHGVLARRLNVAAADRPAFDLWRLTSHDGHALVPDSGIGPYATRIRKETKARINELRQFQTAPPESLNEPKPGVSEIAPVKKRTRATAAAPLRVAIGKKNERT